MFRLSPVPMNLVEADVRRLILFLQLKARASLRRLLQFRGLMREVAVGEILIRILSPLVGEREIFDCLHTAK
jgi:hypothetical protein